MSLTKLSIDGQDMSALALRIGTCRTKGCTRLPATNTNFCNYHVCSVSTCPNEKRYEDESYCKQHDCMACDNLREDESLYCEDHKCFFCPARIKDGYPYCSDHLCQNRNCDNWADSDDDYCHSHREAEHDEQEERLRVKGLEAWLVFKEMGLREACIQEAHNATFSWALQPRENTDNMANSSPNLAEWLRNSHGIFWIKGKPGSGKSTLMKYLQSTPLLDKCLRTWARVTPLYRASFYFSGRGSQLEKSLEGFYRTLLTHLIRNEKDFAQIAFPHWRLHDAGHEPTIAVLRDALLRILRDNSSPRKYCFFIDGLDEYEERDSELQDEFARDILTLSEMPWVKIVVASRPHYPYIVRFVDCPTLRMHELTAADIEAYVVARIGSETAPDLRDEDRAGELASLAKEVAQKAEGVFLWAVLVVQLLRKLSNSGRNFRELHARLQCLPVGLGTLMEQISDNRMPDLSGPTSHHHNTSLRHEVYDSLVTSFPLVSTITYSRRHSVPSSSAPIDCLTDTLPTLISRETVPTSVTNSTNYRHDRWESGSVGSIPDTFLLAPDIKEQMQEKFAYDIIVALKWDHDTQNVMSRRATNILSQLLKEFTIFCRTHAGNESEINATRFVRHSRKDIEGFFENFTRVTAAEPDIDVMDSDQEREPYIKDIKATIDDWNTTLADQDVPEEPPSGELDDEFLPKLPADFEQSRAFLQNSAEYGWLLSQIMNIGKYDYEPNTKAYIRRTILDALDVEKSPSMPIERALQVVLPWDPYWFMKSQFPDATELPPLESVVTICGSSVKPYATTCGEYVQLVWPTYGREGLQIVQDRIDGLAGIEQTTNFVERHMMFEITGDYLRSSEIVEVLVWLATACRASNQPFTIATCKPHLKRLGSSLAFQLDYELSDIVTGKPFECWHAMFRNPVIAFEYPVPARSHQEEPGLEVSTSMLSALSRASWATVFGGIVVLKGWCTMATMVAKMGESVIWHFAANHNGDRIPYPQQLSEETFGISEGFFPGVRHFVAWTQSVKLLTGTSNALYNGIYFSRCDPVIPGVRIEPGLAISGGKYLTMALRISLGTKDTPMCTSTDDYRTRIDKASRWNVIFSDVETRLHWLSDGASAILHFCRAYLSPELTPRHGSNHVLAQISEFESKTAYGPEWAFSTLVDPRLRRVPLDVSSVEHKEKTTRKGKEPEKGEEEHSKEDTMTMNTFESLAIRYFMYLEQAHDRASGVRQNKDIYVKVPWIDSDIVGFDFLSVLRSDDSVAPRRFQLCSPARQWLKFAEQIDSINILGQDFGTLIELSPQIMPDTPGPCHQTTAPPPGRDYLVAPLAVLKTNAEPQKHTSTSVQLAHGFHWHNVNKSFCTCDSPPCRPLSLVKLQTKPVKDDSSIKRDHPIFDKHPQGAIIFDQDDYNKGPESEASTISMSVHSGESSRTSVSPVSTRTSESSGSHRFGSMKNIARGLFPKKKGTTGEKE